MRIQRIDICGFKSFNQRAVIAFDDRITGIVGPNGCGKSNVVDAVRWVMGEQSAKHLRGRAMEDVIFNGSETEGPSGMAEVALTLRNDRPLELPAQYQEFGEITVARRLYRDGRSEYSINKAGCRLLDITELFLGTGVGTRAYSIIEQGKVGLIVNSKPEERRALLEEAAGITKYKARKRIAERKLEYTAQNLLRLNDIVGELRRQLTALERQARKAERYRELKREIREIELHEAVGAWLGARAELAHLSGVLAVESAQVDACSSSLCRVEGELASARSVLSAGDADLEGLRERSHALELEAQRQAQAEAFAREQRVELAHRIEEIEAYRREASIQREQSASERATLVDLQASIEEELKRSQWSQTEVEAQVVRHMQEESDLSAALELQRARFSRSDSEAAGLRARLAADDRRRVELVERAERVSQELASVEQRRAELSRQLSQSSGQTEEARQQRLLLVEKREDVEGSVARARQAFEENEKLRRQLRDELADRRSRLQSLEELHRNLEGHARGVRSVLSMDEGRAALEGVRGLLADAFHAPREIESALEVFLAQRLQDVVVDDAPTALRGVAFLKDADRGRATFLPLAARPPQSLEGPKHPECLGRALDLVQVMPGAESVAASVLGQVWVMQTLDGALAARAAGAECNMVALSGEILWSSGAITAGALEGAGVGALSQRREIEELGHAISDLQARLEHSQKQHAEVSQRIASEEAALRALTADAQAQEVAFVHVQQDVRRMTEQGEALRTQSDALSNEQQTLQTSLDDLHQDRRVAEIDLRRVEVVAIEARALVERQSAALAESASLAAGSRERLTELKIKVASDSQRSEATGQQLERNRAQADELAVRLRAAGDESERHVARIEDLKLQAEEIARRLEELQQLKIAAGGEIEGLNQLQSERIAAVDTLEQRLKELRNKVDAARAELGKLRLQEREVVLQLAHLLGTIRDRHDLDLETEVARFHMLPPFGDAEQQRLGQLREAVARMGEVNLTAIVEHDELAHRHQVLAEQKLDLERSIARLKEAIVRINRTSRERFRETFELVNARFSEVFPRLFRGGKAGLALIEEGGDVLEAGVEIFAQPPGKRLQSVNLLSGGEKALTAVALIFAIFLIKPTPFCLLDEVDAPLDDANVDRYNDLVREISKISQFILITHNKRTMEIGDTLYGVTMEEPGCSKLVSVKLHPERQESAAA